MGSIVAAEDEEVTMEVREASPAHYLLKIESLSLLSEMNLRLVVINGKMRRFHPIKSVWGLPKFLSHKTFKEASNGYLVEDKCVFGAEIFVVQRRAIGECLSLVKSNGSFKHEWKICNFSNLGEDWLSEEFTVGDYKCCGCIQKVMETIRDVISQYSYILLVLWTLITIKK